MPTEPGVEFAATVRALVPGMRVFGRFELIRQLGRGGMGIVWQARDDYLRQDMALKFLPEAVGADDASVDELARETRRARDLAHHHIVRVYDLHQGDGMAAISMEWVDGATLTRRRLDQPNRVFEPEQLVEWVDQLAEALDYAHLRARVVHRDLKPSNLMIDARGELKITDFGISASVSDSVTRVSRAASSSGSPPYMSPQQMLGHKPSPADDIYAVGATLYELLTGKPPFHSGNIVLQAQTVVPPPVAQRRRELGVPEGNVPASWEATIAACLAKQPEMRPPSAGELPARLAGRIAAAIAPPAVPPPPAASAVPPPAAGTVGGVADRAEAPAGAPAPAGKRASGRTRRAAPAASDATVSTVEIAPSGEAGERPARRESMRNLALVGLLVVAGVAGFQGPIFGAPLGALSACLALGLVVRGLGKLLGFRRPRAQFKDFGWPPWARRVTGLLELLGAAGFANSGMPLLAPLAMIPVESVLVVMHRRAGHAARETAPSFVLLILAVLVGAGFLRYRF